MALLFRSFLVNQPSRLIVGAPQETAGFLFGEWESGDCNICKSRYLLFMPDEKESTESPEPPSDSEAKESGQPSAKDQMEAYEEDLKNSDWGHQPC